MPGPKKYTKEDIPTAVADVRNNELSIRKAVAKYKVRKCTISDQLKGKVIERNIWGSKPVLVGTDENQMIDCYLKITNGNRLFKVQSKLR